MDRLLCGIDGGGSVTKIVVSDEEGNIVLFFTEDSINHYSVGVEQTRSRFRAIESRLLSETGRLPDSIFIGDSALASEADEQTTHSLTGGIFGSSKITLHSDVYIALLAYTSGNPGAILISGTGSMACGVDRKGNYHTVGGWGHILGDEGSGYHMALAGIQAALRGFDKISGRTGLTDRVKSFFGLKELNELIDLVYHPSTEKSVIAAFAREVLQLAASGDHEAQRIVSEETDWLSRLGLVICEKCEVIKLGYSGSVVQKNETIRRRLYKKLNRKGILLESPGLSPELGAVIGAFQAIGLRVTGKVRLNLLKFGLPQVDMDVVLSKK